MTPKEQARLYDAVKGARTLRVADMVPPSRRAFEPVHHWGHNSLPVFTMFQKRFLRPEGEGAVAGEYVTAQQNQGRSARSWRTSCSTVCISAASTPTLTRRTMPRRSSTTSVGSACTPKRTDALGSVASV